MTKWIQKTVSSTASAGTSATLTFSAATAGSVLVAIVASNTVLSTPTGWTVARSAVDSQALYVWTKSAVANENQFITVRSVANIAITSVIYELPTSSAVITSSAQLSFNVSGVAVTGISGMQASPKLLMHLAAYAPSASTVTASAAFDDATIVDNFDKASSANETIMLLSGYLEDSTFTSWAPRLLLGDVAGGSMGSTSERITIAFSVPPQLPTPLVTVTTQQNPSSIGGSNGSITITWPLVAGANSYSTGIVGGIDQTTGFIIAQANATSPYTYTGLVAGQYTLAVRAEP